MVRFSDIIDRIAKRHGAKPRRDKPIEGDEFKRPDLAEHVRSVFPDGVEAPPGPPPMGDPTQEISQGVMARLFKSVLNTAPGAETRLAMRAVPGGTAVASDSNTAGGRSKGFRNHAELLKFVSQLINEIEDALK